VKNRPKRGGDTSAAMLSGYLAWRAASKASSSTSVAKSAGGSFSLRRPDVPWARQRAAQHL